MRFSFLYQILDANLKILSTTKMQEQEIIFYNTDVLMINNIEDFLLAVFYVKATTYQHRRQIFGKEYFYEKVNAKK